MKTINLPFDIFKSDKIFHDAFSKIMGFTGFYGNNWDAWIDCMSYINDSETDMSQVQVAPGEHIEFVVSGYIYSNELDESIPFRNFYICTGFVNRRFKDRGSETRIIISN